MKGILRPCRRQLGPDLYDRWLGHLCGLCLALRDTAGQSARPLTGYDVLLVPVLTEAQAGPVATEEAGPCPLRGFRTAQVVPGDSPAMRGGTAVALLSGAAGLRDKVVDGDAPLWLRPAVSRAADRFARAGQSVAAGCGLDASDMLAAPSRGRSVEAEPGASLARLLEPTGKAVGAVFAHTSAAAGVPTNEAGLRRLGDAFGRLVHLADATQDRAADRRHHRFNPLAATRTSDGEAAELARSFHDDIRRCLGGLQMAEPGLVTALLSRTLGAAVERVWGPRAGVARPARRRATPVVGLAAALAGQAAMWGGRRGGPYGEPYGDPYYGGYGPRRGCRGPSCGELLACDCCANCACNECCGEDCCCCCV